LDARDLAVDDQPPRERSVPAVLARRGVRHLGRLDVDQHGGAVYQDWRLEGDQAAVAAFRQSVSGIKLARPAAQPARLAP
jgi:hypothetical protein